METLFAVAAVTLSVIIFSLIVPWFFWPFRIDEDSIEKEDLL